MSYTSGTAMDQRGLRDVERWRDKIEVRLDNRQVFFLFFGSALVACLLFVLGVIVGKRLESRGRAVAPEVEDPLALLDKVASTPRTTQAPAVTFPQALFGKNAAGPAKKVETKLVVPAPVESGKVEGKSEGKIEAKTTEPVAAPAPGKPMVGKALAKVDQPSEASKPAEKPVASKPAPVASAPAPAEAPKPVVPSKPAVVAAPAVKIEDEASAAPKGPVPVVGAATDAAKGQGRYTLQLSSFQDRAEAEAFAGKVGADKTFITVSEIPGKGTWYRVRVGDFASQKEAMAGKLAFEKKHGVIAYVTQR